MSYYQVIDHIQKVMNSCGDPVRLIMTGTQTIHESGQMSIEIKAVQILRKNNCCVIPAPQPICSENQDEKYWVNRIRISTCIADDYSKGFPFTDEEIRNMICTKSFLFGFFK